MNIFERFSNAWKALTNKTSFNYDKSYVSYSNYITGSEAARPWHIGSSSDSEKSIVGAVFTRIAIDCSCINVSHVMVDKEKNSFKEHIPFEKSYLNKLFKYSSNIDQTFKVLMRDMVISMFDEGFVAVVPVEYDDEDQSHIFELRVCKILEWYPEKIKVIGYNEKINKQQEIIVDKNRVAIIESPFYTIMNMPNSTLKRLTSKLNLLDYVDKQSSAGKLDLIIQLPYVIKSEARKQQADERRKEIESQLTGTQYGIAYTDGTEKITQLNRPVENNLMKQIEYLTSMLYSQLSMDESILNGTADEKTLLRYTNSTLKPIMDTFTEEFTRKFLSKEAFFNGERIMYFNNSFSVLPLSSLADVSDKFTRNEILSSNEIRQLIGFVPSSDPRADMLLNKNNLSGDMSDLSSIENQNQQVNDESERKPITGSTKVSDLK